MRSYFGELLYICFHSVAKDWLIRERIPSLIAFPFPTTCTHPSIPSPHPPHPQVCPFLELMLRSALEPNVDPNSLADVRLVVRCTGAVLRRHNQLAPDKCSFYIQV